MKKPGLALLLEQTPRGCARTDSGRQDVPGQGLGGGRGTGKVGTDGSAPIRAPVPGCGGGRRVPKSEAMWPQGGDRSQSWRELRTVPGRLPGGGGRLAGQGRRGPHRASSLQETPLHMLWGERGGS